MSTWKWTSPWEYAMYKGDELLCMGTKEEICKEMNIKPATFNFYRTAYYKQNRYYKNRKYKKTINSRRVIIRVDGEDKIWNE